MTTEISLVHFDRARTALAEATRIDEVKQIRDQAEALRQYIRQQKGSLEMQNQAAEIKIRAERRAGEMLKDSPRNEGGRPPEITGSIVSPVFQPPKLEELGISKQQSYRWQLEAELPEEKLEELIARTKDTQDELTSKAILKAAQDIKREQQRDELEAGPLPQGLFNVVYADPPWQYQNSGISGSAENHYPTLSTEAICYYKDPSGRRVQDLFAPDAALFLWVTNPLLKDGLQVAEAWGCEYKTNIVWVKPKAGQGFYVKGQHELLLICIRGSFRPDDSLYIRSVIEAPLDEHSHKPQVFRDTVAVMYPNSTKVEVFARTPQPGWTAWGNEIGD